MPPTDVPPPRPALADPALVRPDRTKPEARDPAKLWLNKNENPDPALAAVVREVISSLPPETHFTCPDLAPLYLKLAKHAGVGAENLLLAPGSDGAIRVGSSVCSDAFWGSIGRQKLHSPFGYCLWEPNALHSKTASQEKYR